MKKYIIAFTFLIALPLSVNGLFAQNNLSDNDDEKDTTEKGYDTWSVELGVGNNKPTTPFTSNRYFTGDPTNFVALADMKHYSFAVRKMLTPSFGLRLRANYDEYTNQKESGSLQFKSEMIYGDLEGVANLGHLLKFNSFSSRIGLLAHLGGYVGYFTPKNDNGQFDESEFNGGFVVGLTPMVRITNSIAFFIDLSSYTSFRQHYAWDGYSLQNASDGATTHTMSNESKNLNSQLFTFSAGLKVYLGGNEQHADWYNDTKVIADKSDKLGKRIDDIENRLLDTDRDGVVDYLDTEPNTVSGVTVDTKGRAIDRNNNGVPDELESKGRDGVDGKTVVEKQDAIKMLVERGYVNVFFDVNMDDPNVGSTNNVYQIIHFLRSYPDAKAKLMGFADVRGDEAKNQDLSTRRAQKVYNILVASGIDANRLTIAGNGVDTSYPADSKIGLDLARRVSVVLE